MKPGNYTFRKKPGILSWLLIAAVIAVLDQLTKLWVTKVFQLGQKIEVTSFFNLILAHNEGAAFSFLASAGGWQRYFFTGFSIVAILLILFFIKRNPTQKLFCWSLTLILGGAIGNLVDRIAYGYVIDFLDFHAAGWHWPAFNVADSAITVGIVLFVIDEFRRVNKSS